MSDPIGDARTKLESIEARVKNARARLVDGTEHDAKGRELETRAGELRRRLEAAADNGWDEFKREMHEDLEGFRHSADSWLGQIDDAYKEY